MAAAGPCTMPSCRAATTQTTYGWRDPGAPTQFLAIVLVAVLVIAYWVATIRGS